MKGFFRFSIALMTAQLLCGAALVVGYVMLVVMTIPQLPSWAQPGVEQWLFDVPQYAETSDNGSYGNSTPAGMSVVPWDGYVGPGSEIYGLPMIGPIQHWSDWYDKPLLGCIRFKTRITTLTLVLIFLSMKARQSIQRLQAKSCVRAQTDVSPDRQSLQLERLRELPDLGLILGVVTEEDVWQFDARGVLPNER